MINKISSIYHALISSGSSAYTKLDDVRRVRILNLSILISVVCGQLLLLYIWVIGNFQEVYPIVFFITASICCFLLNRFYGNQRAVIFMLVCCILVSYWVMYISAKQSAAPYFNLIFALLAIYLVTNRWVKNIIVIIAFSSFCVLNGYQLYFRPFSLVDYLPISILMVALYLVIRRYDAEYQKSQITIQAQAMDLVALNKEKHAQSLKLKQKDIEMVLANASARDQMTKNLSGQLQEVLKSDNLQDGLKKVIRELGYQNELINRLDQIRQNVDEINAEFYERLRNDHPDLSKTELVLCAHLKLGLSNKDMAQIKNSTENTINVAKARLRKKMGIESNKELQQYMLKF